MPKSAVKRKPSKKEAAKRAEKKKLASKKARSMLELQKVKKK